IENHVIRPLLKNKNTVKKISDILSVKSVTEEKQIKNVLTAVNNGSVVLFVDGLSLVYMIDVADFKERNIEKAENETVLKGPKEAFTEGVQTNLSLIRKKIKDENLMIETTTVGRRTKNDVFIVYINDIA